MKEIMCQVCGRVKVAIVEGSVKLRPGARIVCSACVLMNTGKRYDDDKGIDEFLRMFGEMK